MENLSSENNKPAQEEKGRETGFFRFNYRVWDYLFRKLLQNSALSLIVLVAAMVISFFIISLPVIKETGWNIIFGTNWDPTNDEFGGAPFVLGTLITSILALLFSLPFALAISIFLGEYVRRGPLFIILNSTIELLAGIPSIIYGAWGLYMLVPLVQKWQLTMTNTDIVPIGLGIFSASVVLAIMIIPFSASIAREIINMVPQDLKDASYALGSTRYDMVKNVALPYAKSGIFAGVLLSFGRALGETMAVTMVIGNMNAIPTGIFSAGNTIASVIANEYAEASDLHISALTEIGFILFLITILFGLVGRFVISKMEIKQ